MMRLLCKTAQSEERGAVIIVTCIAIVVLLMLIGLAIDSGNLYRARMALQKAADAGALSGVGYTVHKGRTEFEEEVGDGSKQDFLSEKAQEVVEANLELSGLSPEQDGYFNVEATYVEGDEVVEEGSAYEFRVTVTKEVDFIFMDLVPFEVLGLTSVGESIVLEAVATSRRLHSNVAMILDSSDSMGCPATGSCDCKTVSGSGSCPTPHKFDDLIDASKEFVRMFDYNNDKIAFIPFNLQAKAYDMDDYREALGTTYISETMLDTILDEHKVDPGPLSSTNVCDAFMTAYKKMEELVPGKEAAYVYFSDGAPTAGRFLFKNPRDLPSWNPDGFGNYDYVHYTVQWVDGSEHLPGPSVLSQTGLVEIGHQGANPPHSETPPLVPDCTGEMAPVVAEEADIAGAVNTTLGGCLDDLEAHLPSQENRTYGGPSDPAFEGWRAHYYHCAIEMADFIREQKGLFYVIGLGEPAAYEDDPYQNINDTASRKDYFLTRVANDYDTAIRRPAKDPEPWAHPEYAYRGYKSLESWNERAASRQGEYLPTPDTSELRSLFRKIAKKIQLGLIE